MLPDSSQTTFRLSPGSAITNGREPRSCLGRVFNSKLGCIAILGSKWMVSMQPLLKLKTRPRARPASLSLSVPSPISFCAPMTVYQCQQFRPRSKGDTSCNVSFNGNSAAALTIALQCLLYKLMAFLDVSKKG
jgi:hypothetical protein